MSTSEEIRAVYEQDIAEQEKIVRNRQGILAFLDGENLQVQDFPEMLLSDDDRDLLKRIYENDADWRTEETDGFRLSEEDKRRFGELLLELAGDGDA